MKKVELIFLIPFTAAILAFTSPASAQSCSGTGTPGGDFVDSISQIQTNASRIASGQEPGGDAALMAWEEAKKAVAKLCSCNPLQAQYRALSLEYLTWFREAEACNALYFALGTPGGPSVGEWLACISPVNAGLLAARNAQSAIQFDTRIAPCDASPPTPGGNEIIRAEVYQKTREIVKTLSKLSPKKLIANLKKGIGFALNPQSDGRAESVIEAFKAVRKAGHTIKTYQKVAAGTAQAVATLPAQVQLRLLPDGARHINDPLTQKLRFTTTFTPDDGAAISSSRQFQLR